MSSCNHGFVIPDNHAEKRFLCKECMARFTQYPRGKIWHDREIQQTIKKALKKEWAMVSEVLTAAFEKQFVDRVNRRYN